MHVGDIMRPMHSLHSITGFLCLALGWCVLRCATHVLMVCTPVRISKVGYDGALARHCAVIAFRPPVTRVQT